MEKKKLNLLRGTRTVSFLFIASSVMIAAGIMFAANMYYDLDSNQVVTEETFTVGSGGSTYFNVDNSTGDTTIAGDLAVNGGDITTTSTTWNFDVGDGGTIYFRDGTNNLMTIADNGTSGNVTVTGTLQTGSNGTDGQLIIYSEQGDTDHQLIFQPNASMSEDSTYIWPASRPSGSRVLTSDASGNLTWDTIGGAGGVDTSGTPAANYVAYFTDSNTITGDSNFYWDSSNHRLGIGTTPANYPLEVAGAIQSGTSSTAGQLRITDGSGHTLIFDTGSSMSGDTEYYWPDALPSGNGYFLTSDTDGTLHWTSAGGAGLGTITAVGDITSGEAFTSSSPGQYLYFKGSSQAGKTQLVATDTASDYTITLPAATGTVALGTGTANYVAYWSGTNTLSAEQYLSVSRGGLGGDVTPAGAGEILYSTGTTAYDSLAAGTSGQILTSGGAAAPSWSDIADLITVQNGLSESGTTTLTVELGGNLTKSTTITSPSGQAYDMIFNLAGTGDFKVQDNGTDILTVSDDGKVYFKTYPLAESGKQILIGMVPIMGFDLPVQCSTACDDEYATVSRTIEDYPFPDPETGTTRKNKLIIRYATSDASTNVTFRVYDETAGSYVDQGGGNYDISVSASPSTDLGKGVVAIADVVLPSTSTNDWHLEVQGASGLTVKIYQIFLAAYNQID